jgi:hypothetical protein
MVVDASGKAALIAFDKYSNPATGELARSRTCTWPPPQMARASRASPICEVDIAKASDLKRRRNRMNTRHDRGDPALGQYIRNVAGIAVGESVRAHPYLAHRVQRHLAAAPTRADKDARNAQAVVDFMKRRTHAGVSMSWGRQRQGHRSDLRWCVGKTADDRKRWRWYFDIGKNALTKAFASAPDILFITAAGNSNQDATFVEDIPAGIVLPNLMTVGAVDRAGDEASFTSYGPTVVAHANGYQVESVIPGGEKLAESGTSMASPNVANLAAKILAVNPKLTRSR